MLRTHCAKSYIDSPCPPLRLHAVAAQKFVGVAFHEPARIFRGTKADVRVILMGPAGLDLSDDT